MIKKTLATQFLGTSPVASFITKRYRTAPLVVLYHGVTSIHERHGIENYRQKHIDVQSFEKQLAWLKRHFDIVPLKVIEESATNKKVPEKPLCAITFDDGYKNNFDVAYPLLKKYNVPATIFITTKFIDKEIALWPDLLEESITRIPRPLFSIEWKEGRETYSSRSRADKIGSDMKIRDRLKKISSIERNLIIETLMSEAKITKEDVFARASYAPLSWENLYEMLKNGIEFGAHTDTHPILSYLSKEEQEKEIMVSVQKMKAHNIPVTAFAYPNGQLGDWNSDTESILTNLGFTCAWSTKGMRVDIIHDNLFGLPRITLDNTNHMSRFRALASNAIPFLKKITRRS